MFAIIQNTEKGTLPTVVNTHSHSYCDFIMAGYTEIERGTKREMEDKAAELLETLVYEMQND